MKGVKKSMFERLSRENAFTLIEILLVITIIGILVAMIVPQLSGRSKQAKISIAKADIEANLGVALDLYELDNGTFPETSQGLRALIEKPEITPVPQNWNGPYIKRNRMPRDPWGNAYLYTYPGVNNPQSYDLWSSGPDGTSGGGDDITNWESD